MVAMLRDDLGTRGQLERPPLAHRASASGGCGRRWLLASGVTLGALAAAAPLAGCAGATREPGAAPAAGPYTLTWGVRTGVRPEDVEAVAKEYQAKHPRVTVEIFNAPGGIAPSLEKLAGGAAAGTPFDVITGHAYAATLQAALDLLQPVEDIARKEKFDLAKYNKAFLDSAGRYQNKLYALPYA